jgi:hypothetical protein
MLPVLALATLVLAATGALAAQRLRTWWPMLVVASAGTLLLAIGLGTRDALAAGLFYLVNSTLVAALWFLLADRIATARGGSDAGAGLRSGWAPLGVVFFVAAVAVAGVPPLAASWARRCCCRPPATAPLGGLGGGPGAGPSLAMMVALARAGSVLFWKPGAVASAVAPAASGAGAQSARRMLACWPPCWPRPCWPGRWPPTPPPPRSSCWRQGLYRRGDGRAAGAAGLRCAPRNARAGRRQMKPRVAQAAAAIARPQPGLLLAWLMLNQSLSVGQMLLGLALAWPCRCHIALPITPLRPQRLGACTAASALARVEGHRAVQHRRGAPRAGP